MEISKEIFEKLKLVVGPTSKKPEQWDLIYKNFELNEICDQRLGKFFPNYLYEQPEDYDVESFFGTIYDNPENRMKEYKSKPVLSDNENEKFLEYMYDEIQQGESYLPVFFGALKYKNQKLIIFATIVGAMMGGDYDTELEGIFNTYEEGIKTLYSDGDFI